MVATNNNDFHKQQLFPCFSVTSQTTTLHFIIHLFWFMQPRFPEGICSVHWCGPVLRMFSSYFKAQVCMKGWWGILLPISSEVFLWNSMGTLRGAVGVWVFQFNVLAWQFGNLDSLMALKKQQHGVRNWKSLRHLDIEAFSFIRIY